MQNFKNLQEAIKYFKNEEVCREHLEKMRFPDGQVVCPKCQTKGAYRYLDFKHYKCRNQKCKNRFSIMVGTMMEGTKLPLSKWFLAIWLITNHKKGISSCQLARDLGIGQKAAWFMLHRIREMVTEKQPVWLSNTVEVDETWVGGKMKNKSMKYRKERRKLNGYSTTDHLQPVMGFVERGGNAVLKVIPKRTDDSLKDLVKQHVTANSLVITDSHLGFVGLDKMFSGHQSVNHNIEEYARGDIYTNSVEGLFSHLKRSILGIYHHVSVKHLSTYCNETAFRYNTRKIKDVDRFNYTLQRTEGRLKWYDLINKSNPSI